MVYIEAFYMMEMFIAMSIHMVYQKRNGWLISMDSPSISREATYIPF